MQVINWQLIVQKHGPVVWQTAYRLLGNKTDAADCFQETFVSALEVSRRQRVGNFTALLIRLATTRAIDKLRQRIRDSQLHTDADVAFVPSDNPGPCQELERQELADKLREALGQLPPQEAQVFCLRYLSDMTYREIAKELRMKTSTAGVMLHRVKTKLQNLIGGEK